uniref:C-type lectin domain-containing protein n=1 Tax=Stegastes partitus TaxID=144197 RepID=A0A3B5ADB7_9TELE
FSYNGEPLNIFFFFSNPGPQCDLSNGWRQYASDCFKLKSDIRKSWTLARRDCVFEGGDLASITTEEENQFISGIMGGWEWTDGSPFRYIRWNAGNPDDYAGEDCLSILINNGYWNDDNCEYKRGYIFYQIHLNNDCSFV